MEKVRKTKKPKRRLTVDTEPYRPPYWKEQNKTTHDFLEQSFGRGYQNEVKFQYNTKVMRYIWLSQGLP
jgi:hypothetical protein